MNLTFLPSVPCQNVKGTQGLLHQPFFFFFFCDWFFGEKVSRTICVGWLRTAVPLISAS
jgi:hypothetical protein